MITDEEDEARPPQDCRRGIQWSQPPHGRYRNHAAAPPAALEPGGGHRLGHRVRPRASARPCRCCHCCWSRAAPTRRFNGLNAGVGVRRRHGGAAAGATPGPHVRHPQFPAGELRPAISRVMLLLKRFESLGAWFALRACSGVIGSGIFTASEAWINLLAGGRRARTDRRAICGGAVRRLRHRPAAAVVHRHRGLAPFIANAGITAVAALPLLGPANAARDLGRERGPHPLACSRGRR